MLGLSTRSKTQQPAAPTGARTPDARRRILAAIAAAEASTPERLAQQATRVAHALAREARARRDLEAASFERGQLEAEQLAGSTTADLSLAGLRRDLATGAPPEIATMQRDVAALVDTARLKAQSVLVEGYQGVDGRTPTLVCTNVDTITEFCRAARQVTDALEALKFTETPDLERLGPFAELSLPAAQLEAAGRYDESGGFVARPVIVPAALAALYAALAGVASPKALLSPGEVREAAWDAERSAQRRWHSGEAWR